MAKLMPIQGRTRNREPGRVPEAVYMAAYEVYTHLYGEQKALIEGECRGGFGHQELVAFLYARAFPRAEWRRRADEAFDGINIEP